MSGKSLQQNEADIINKENTNETIEQTTRNKIKQIASKQNETVNNQFEQITRKKQEIASNQIDNNIPTP